jgi:hypothetical protein
MKAAGLLQTGREDDRTSGGVQRPCVYLADRRARRHPARFEEKAVGGTEQNRPQQFHDHPFRGEAAVMLFLCQHRPTCRGEVARRDACTSRTARADEAGQAEISRSAQGWPVSQLNGDDHYTPNDRCAPMLRLLRHVSLTRICRPRLLSRPFSKAPAPKA